MTTTFVPPPFNRLIQYQLHVGVYYAVDANGNDKRRGIGKFLDLLDRVEYLRDLGINAIQLLPIQEFATPTSRGYNGVDLFSPEMDYQVEGAALARYLDKANRLLADFGKPALSLAVLEPGPNQLKCVVDIFHLHGIAVMVDLVFNHAGPGFNDQSLWFLDRQPAGDDNRSLYFTDHEWVGGRVFAYWQAPVRQFLIDNARQCLEEYHVDGIRYDEVTVIAANGGGSFCQDLSSTIRFARPGAIQIAEYWGGDRDIAVRPAPFGFGFDAAWNDRLRDAVRGAISAASGGRDAFVDIEDLARAYATPAGFGAAWRAVNFLEDHDTVFNGRSPRMARLADPGDSRSWFARSRARVGLGLLLAARGNPMIFMGQEILEDKPWDDNVGGHADLFIWWDGLKTDAVMRDYLQFCRDLIWLRRREPALSSEQLHISTRNSLDRIIAIHRWVENVGNDLLVVANLQEMNRSRYRVGFPAGGPWREIFNSDVYDTMPNPAPVGNGGAVTADDLPWDGMPASSPITLPANGFVIFAR